MKKSKNIKPDKKFILCMFALLAVLCMLNFVLKKDNEQSEMNISELPESSDTDIYGKLIISEILTKNGGVYISEDGELCDFVELYNGSSKDISLEGYGLTDKKNKVKWTFPDVTIKAGEYLVINLTGKTQDGLNASFKLAGNGGESLLLIGKNGKITDAVTTVAMNKNYSMIRNGNEWLIVSYATPGFENSLAGLESYKNTLKTSGDGKLVINEFLCKNAGNYKNNEGIYTGFIEVKNISDEVLQLSDYYLSDDAYLPYKYRLPEVKLKAGEIYLLYTGDNSYIYENYTGFSLNSKNGSLLLSSAGKILAETEYENLPNGCAYIRGSDGSYSINSCISPGFENTADGINAFQKQYLKKREGLMISEIMSSNSKYLPQNGYAFYDWIELYNGGKESVNLADYAISTDASDLSMCVLPDVTLAPGEYYVIMCSGNEELSNDSYVHCSIKIGNQESIYLSSASGNIIDSVFAYNIPINYSYSSGEEYGWFYTETATPLEKNAEGSIAVSASPDIDMDAGIYSSAELDIQISGQGTIYYTTDGSEPSFSSAVFDTSLHLDKSTVIKASCCQDGFIMSDTVTKSYIINDPHNIPVLSLSLNERDFDDLNDYVDGDDKDLTFQAYIEFFEEDGGFSQPCGLRLQGESTRVFAKKSYTLSFDGEWGSTSLDYKVFDDIDCSSYDAIVIRGGSNAASTMPFKDEFVTELMDDYLEVRTYKTCVLYVNGEYYGIVNLREKINANMIADHYNADKEQLTIIKYSANRVTQRNAWITEYGNNTYYEEVVKWAAEHDLSKKENYEYICSKIDIEEFCDYWIYMFYIGQPDIYNTRLFSHPDIDGGKWHYIAYDFDWALVYPSTERYEGNYLSNLIFNSSTWMMSHAGQYYDNRLHLALVKNNDFVDLFLSRLQYHLANELDTEHVLEIFDSFMDVYSSEIKRDREVFGYTYRYYTIMTNMTRSFIQNRKNEMLQQVQEYFNLTDAQMKSRFGSLW